MRVGSQQSKSVLFPFISFAVLLSTAMTGFTTDMYPILSMTKIEPCFADIISPTTYNYARSNEWATRYRWPNNVRWEDKANVACL